MKRFFLTSLFVAIITLGLFSATVDTVKVFSASMNKDVKTVVIRPTKKAADARFPVLYLLHGYSGRYDSWLNDAPFLPDLADRYQMMFVCPDGGFGSWYWDSPVDPKFRYETFVAQELISYIDNHYSTVASREGRAITGLSMGGHGGLYLGFRHQDQFGACGSMAGGVDIRPFPDNWDMSKRLGNLNNYPERWEAYSVMGQLHLLRSGSIKIIFDCGTGDFFFDVNRRLHNELLYRNIPHDFTVRPGVHNGQYWGNAVKYQILYFHNYFLQL